MRTLFHLTGPKALNVMKNYRTNILLMVFVVSALLLIACTKSGDTNREAAAPSTAAPASSPAHTTSPTTTAAATEIGVPECDAFLKAYEACVHDKVPAAARPTFETGLANWKKSWHDLAANPQTKGTLAAACKTARDNANTSMKAYKCTF